MDFYKELLESFSRIKGRKLRLLEEEGLDPEAQATKLKDTAIANKAPFSTPAKVVASNGKNIGVYVKGANTNNPGPPIGGLLDSNGGVNNRHSSDLTTPDGWAEFVGLFGEGGESETGFLKDVPVFVTPALDIELGNLGVDLNDEEAVRPFQELLEKATQNANVDSGNKHIVGATFVQSLLKEYPVAVSEGEFYRIEPRPTTIERSLALANAINNLGKDSCSNIKRTDNGKIVMYANYGGKKEGTVFSGSQKDVVENMVKGCSEIETINILTAAGGITGAENNIRGITLEKPSSLFSLHRSLQLNKHLMDEKQRGNVISLIQGLKKEIETGIKSLDESKETWLRIARDTALPEKSQAEYDQLLEFFEDKGGIIKAALIVAKASNEERLPDYSFQAGDQTRGGKKQDTVEMWTEKGAAIAAIRGATGETGRITGLVPIKASEAFGMYGRSDLFKQYVDNKIINDPDQVVYVSEVSYKNLFRAAGKGGQTTMGVGTDADINDYMKGKGVGKELFKTFKNAAKMSKEDKTRFDEIHQSQMQIRNDVEQLSNNIMTSVAGQTVGVQALSDMVDGAVETITRDSTFREAHASELRTNLMSLIRDYKRASDKDKPNLEKQMKEELLTASLMSDLRSKMSIEGGAIPAKMYSLALMYKAGASRNKHTLKQSNDLNSGMTYISRQNLHYEQIAESINNGDAGEFAEPIISNSGITYRRKDKTSATMGVSWNKKKATWLATESKTMTEEHSQTKRRFFGQESGVENSNTILDAMNKLHELFGVLKDKISVMDL